MPDRRTQDRSIAKTSRGVPWSEVLVGDLPGMVEDGKKAAALLEAMKNDVKQNSGAKNEQQAGED